MPWRTVLKNVLFPMEIRRETRRARASGPWSCSPWSVSTASSEAYPAQLSGGMQQRVALCRAIDTPAQAPSDG